MAARERNHNAPRKADAAATERVYVVRYGPWARNLYLGLPAALLFAVISLVALQMNALAMAMLDGVALLLVWICAFPREVRIHPHGDVVVMRRLLALLPLWWRRYPRSEFVAVKPFALSYRMASGDEIGNTTVHLLLKSGKSIPVQSWSAGAPDNWPPPDQLERDLCRLLDLPLAKTDTG